MTLTLPYAGHARHTEAPAMERVRNVRIPAPATLHTETGVETMSYNGWTNYETWLVNLWIDNDLGLDEERAEIVRSGDFQSERACGEAIRDWLYELLKDCGHWPETGLVADLLNAAWNEVDWREIGEHAIADFAECDEESEEAHV